VTFNEPALAVCAGVLAGAFYLALPAGIAAEEEKKLDLRRGECHVNAV
jgi:hypothetical protein